MKVDSEKIKEIVNNIEDVVLNSTDGIDDLEETMVAITKELKERYLSANLGEVVNHSAEDVKNAFAELLEYDDCYDDFAEEDYNFEDDYEDDEL